MTEVKYINGPVIFRSKWPSGNDKFWLVLQPILTINQWQETDMLMYMFITDSYQPNSKDSFDGKLKTFLTYNTLLKLLQNLQERYNLVRDQLKAGLSIEEDIRFNVNKNIELILSGYQTQYGPIVIVGMHNRQHNVTGTSSFTIDKFDEFMNVLSALRFTWFSLFTSLHFSFIEMGRAIKQLSKHMINNQLSILQKLENIEQKLESYTQRNIATDTYNHSRQEIDIDPFINKLLTKEDSHKEVKYDIEEEVTADAIIDELEKITDSGNNEKEDNQTNSIKLPTIKVGLDKVEYLLQLYPYLTNDINVNNFVHDNQELLCNLIVKKRKLISQKDCLPHILIQLLLNLKIVFRWFKTYENQLETIITTWKNEGAIMNSSELTEYQKFLLRHLLEEMYELAGNIQT